MIPCIRRSGEITNGCKDHLYYEKMDFNLWLIKTKVESNNNILKIVLFESQVINDKSYLYMVLLDLDLNIVYRTEPILYFESKNPIYLMINRKLNFINDYLIVPFYKGTKYFLKERLEELKLDYYMNFITLKRFLIKNQLNGNDIVLYDKLENKDIIKINIDETKNLFCVSEARF